MGEAEKKQVEDLRADLQKSLDENDMAAVQSKLDALEKAAQAMSASMYQNAQGAAQEQPASEKKDDDDVVDAEFTEKK